MAVFWRKGYSATSLDDLCEATGMARPSLYAAFGDKSGMFSEALNRFQTIMRERTAKALSEPMIRNALTRLYQDTLDLYIGPDGLGRGCMVFSVAALEAAGDEPLRALVAQSISRLEAALCARFERARDDGEVSADSDPQDLALLATALLHSLSVRARSGQSKRALRSWAKHTVSILLRST
jgi:AcrR family transcriptional regulator